MARTHDSTVLVTGSVLVLCCVIVELVCCQLIVDMLICWCVHALAC